MAKYNVLFSCGHTQTVSLFGKESERKRRIAWFEKMGDCTECYKQYLANKEAATKKEAESKFPMPKLEGSERQVAWAEKIRIEMYIEVKAEIEEILAMTEEELQEEKEKLANLDGANKFFYQRYIIALNVIENASAVWFIENRKHR